jgi:hypothetical protein
VLLRQNKNLFESHQALPFFFITKRKSVTAFLHQNNSRIDYWVEYTHFIEIGQRRLSGRTNLLHLSSYFRKEKERRNKRGDGKGNLTRRGQRFYG